MTAALPALSAVVPRQRVCGRSEGTHVVRATGQALDELALRCGTPVTGRAAWIISSLEAAPAATPTVVSVHDERSGELDAAAVLLHEYVDGIGTLRLATGGDGYTGAVPAVDAAAAQALAHAMAAAIADGDAVHVALGPVPAGDPVLHALAPLLPAAMLVASAPVPQVRRTESCDAADYLAPGMRRSLRKARNRLESDGVPWHISCTGRSARILPMLPDMALAYRDRDHAHGLASPLDTLTGRRAWRERLLRLVGCCGAEVGIVQMSGRLAAYVVGVPDGPFYRVVEGRFVEDFARYSPGRLLEAAMLQRMLDDPARDTLDWMTGTAPSALLAANAAASTERLLWTRA